MIRHWLQRASNRAVLVTIGAGLGMSVAAERGVEAAAEMGSTKIVIAVVTMLGAALAGLYGLLRLWLHVQRDASRNIQRREPRTDDHLGRVLDLMIDNTKRVETRIEQSDLQMGGKIDGVQNAVAQLTGSVVGLHQSVSNIKADQARMSPLLERVERLLVREEGER